MDSSIHEVTTTATLAEKKKLRKEFRFLDMVFFTIAALIGVDTLGAVTSNGPQAFSWLLISAVTFLVPYGLLSAEMGSTFTQEGGMYEWCKLAGGRLFGALGSMLYWISNPLWVGGTLSVAAIIALKTFWFGSPDYRFGNSVGVDATVEIIIALAFIWGTTWCAITSLRFGRWLSVIGSYVKVALFAIFAVLAIMYFLGGHAKGVQVSLKDLIPSNLGLAFGAILPVIIFNWVGFELQNGAGEEMHHAQRDVPRSLIRAGLVTLLAYVVVIGITMFTFPTSQLADNNGFASGFFLSFQNLGQTILGNLGTVLGWLIAIGMVIALASSGGTWIIGADRTYAIASLDRTAPSALGRFSGKYGTPIAVNTMSGIVGSIMMIVSVLINSFGSANTVGLFSIVLGFTISTTTLSYLFIFPAYIILKYKYPHIRRPFQVPGGMVGAWIVTLLPLIYVALASYSILVPLDATIAISGVSRFTYELTQFIILGAIVLLTVIFYIWGQREKRNKDVVVELSFTETPEATKLAVGD